MGMRVVAIFSIIGGAAFAVASYLWLKPLDMASPSALLGRLLFVTGFGGLAVAIWGLVIHFFERINGGVAALGVFGGLGSTIAGLGAAMAAWEAGGAFILLPIGSAAVALDLSRHGDVPRSVAIVHSVTAVAVVIILMAIWTSTPLGTVSELPYTLPWIPYALTWIGIGVTLLRGQPAPDQPMAIGRTP